MSFKAEFLRSMMPEAYEEVQSGNLTTAAEAAMEALYAEELREQRSQQNRQGRIAQQEQKSALETRAEEMFQQTYDMVAETASAAGTAGGYAILARLMRRWIPREDELFGAEVKALPEKRRAIEQSIRDEMDHERHERITRLLQSKTAGRSRVRSVDTDNGFSHEEKTLAYDYANRVRLGESEDHVTREIAVTTQQRVVDEARKKYVSQVIDATHARIAKQLLANFKGDAVIQGNTELGEGRTTTLFHIRRRDLIMASMLGQGDFGTAIRSLIWTNSAYKGGITVAIHETPSREKPVIAVLYPARGVKDEVVTLPINSQISVDEGESWQLVSNTRFGRWMMRKLGIRRADGEHVEVNKIIIYNPKDLTNRAEIPVVTMVKRDRDVGLAAPLYAALDDVQQYAHEVITPAHSPLADIPAEEAAQAAMVNAVATVDEAPRLLAVLDRGRTLAARIKDSHSPQAQLHARLTKERDKLQEALHKASRVMRMPNIANTQKSQVAERRHGWRKRIERVEYELSLLGFDE